MFEKGMFERRKGEEAVEDWDALRYWALEVGVGGSGLETGRTGGCRAVHVSQGRGTTGAPAMR